MEALLSQFSFLANQALQDKSFDPARIHDLMILFEQEAQHSWSAMDADSHRAVQQAQISMTEAENYLDSLLKSSMDDFRSFEEEAKKTAKAEKKTLVRDADTAKKMGDAIGNAAANYSSKYTDAALSSADASMKSAWKGVSFTPSKVHPS